MSLIPTTPVPEDYRRKIAYALMKQGMSGAPVQHWAQGLARLGEGALGGYEMYQADEKDKQAEMDSARARIPLLLQGGQPAQTQPAPQSALPPSTPATPTVGKIYSNDESSPLDPPSGADRDNAVRTVIAEAGNQGPTGQNAVASVIRNRAVNGGYGGDTPSGVVTAKNQFEPWNTPEGRAKMAAIDPASPQYQAAAKALESAYAGNDPTNGAVNFISPKVQTALGRDMPKWAQGKGQDIGDHRFFGSPAQPEATPAPYQVAGPATAASSPVAQALAQQPQAAPQATAQADDPNKAKIIELLGSESPAARKMGKALADSYIASKFKADTKTDHIKDYEYGLKDPRFNEAQIALKKASAQNINVDTKGENAFATKAGQLQAERYNDLATEAQSSKQMLSDVSTLNELGKNIQTGKLAEAKAAIGPYANALGIDVKGLNEIQAFEAIVNRVAPSLRVKGSGAQSDYELKNFLKSLPSLGNTLEGNEIATKTMEGLYQNKLKAAEIGSQALAREITPKEADKMLRELPDHMAAYREYLKKNPQSNAKPVDNLKKKYGLD